ncbi:MAG: hypothetical protein V3T65_06940 [Acidobacteriota bacterium]
MAQEAEGGLGMGASSSPAPPVDYNSGRAGVHTRALAAELSYIVKVFGDPERGVHIQNRYSDIVAFLDEYQLPAELIREAFKIAADGKVPPF